VIKIHSTPFFRWEVKPMALCCKILQRVKDPLRYLMLNRQNSHSFVHSSSLPQMSLLVGLPESSGGWVRSYPQPASSAAAAWLSMLTYHPGDEE
jgi:hypothetical protein